MARKPTIPEPEWEAICARYLRKEDAGAIAASFNVSRSAIYRVLRKRGIPVEKRGGSPPIPDDVKARMKDLYVAGRGASSIAREFGVDKKSVYNVLAKSGVGTRPREDRIGGERRISPGQVRVMQTRRLGHVRGPRGSFNFNAFETLDEPALYWAGYLITDGSIGAYDGRSYRLTLRQARKNREQCEKLREYLESDLIIQDSHVVTFGVRRPVSVLSCTLPDKVAQRLLKLGIRPAKTAKVDAAVELLCQPAFWRGVVDGDGTCTERYLRMNSSSCRLAAAYRRFARGRGFGPRLYKNQAGVWGLNLSGRFAAPMAKLLYGTASPTCRLEYKYRNSLVLAER